MACTKPDFQDYLMENGENGFYCYLYDAKFGGRSKQFIRAVSMQSRNDEYCAFKNDNHHEQTHDNCMAESSTIDTIPYFSQFV